MTTPTVTQVLDIVKPETTVDARIEALRNYTEEIAGEDKKERALDILDAIKDSPRRGRKNGS